MSTGRSTTHITTEPSRRDQCKCHKVSSPSERPQIFAELDPFASIEDGFSEMFNCAGHRLAPGAARCAPPSVDRCRQALLSAAMSDAMDSGNADMGFVKILDLEPTQGGSDANGHPMTASIRRLLRFYINPGKLKPAVALPISALEISLA